MEDNEKKQNTAKGCLVLIVFFAIIVIAFASCGGCGGGGSDKEEEEKTPALTEVEISSMDMEEYARYLADTLGAASSDKERLRDFANENGHLFLYMNASENFTSKLIRIGTLDKSARLFKKAFLERGDIESLELIWYLDLVDQKGNEKEGPVIQITLTKENAATINWENFLSDNLPAVADEYWEHPLFSNK